MDTNIAAWMIGGGPLMEDPNAARDREQLHAFHEGQREARRDRVGPIDRIRAFVMPKPAEKQLDCCPA
jgi:hypothetical protein